MGRREKKKEKKNTGKIILIIILFLIAFLGAYLGYSIQTKGGGMQGVLATILGQDAETLENLEPINILVLGISEDLESRLTDTIMICSYNPKTQRATMLSVPRDTFIGNSKSKATGYDKINAVYSDKGPEGSVKEVEELTGMDIKYYVVVNNNVVIDLVNTIGGVQFDVPIDMNYDDPTQDLHIHLKKGVQFIDGEHAEQLLRFRHNNNGTSYPSEYGDNDFGRMKTQREFMVEVIKQTIRLKNITRIRTIMTTIFQNIETNLSLEEVCKYVPYAVSFDTTNISSNQIPGQSEKCNNLWFFVANEKETAEIVTEMTDYLYAKDLIEEEAGSELENTTDSSVNNVVK